MEDYKKSVHAKLQKAVELELATIPPYLTAVFSIHQDANREAASIIRSVYMEEMLHLVLAANIMSATGGSVKLGKENIPSYPLRLEFDGKGFRDRQFDVNLASFSKATIDTFRQIELPDWAEPEAPEALFVVEGYTIGEFYMGIKKELEDLCDTHSEAEVFSGNPAHQIGEDYYWGGGGKPIVITSLESASNAIIQIIEQGEGADGTKFDGDQHVFDQPEEYAHYFRFNEIFHQRRYRKDDPPREDPTGDPLEVDYAAVYPIKPNCKGTDLEKDPELEALNREFNYAYSLMLSQLEEGFNGNPKVFYTAIMNGMHALGPTAFKMVEMPITGDPEPFNGAPSFEWVELIGPEQWNE